MSERREYMVLEPLGWLKEQEWKQLLGSAVKYPVRPTDAYTPGNALKHNKQPLVENEFEGFILERDVIRRSSRKVEVANLGELRWRKAMGDQLDLKGKVIYVKRLRQHPEFWRTIISKDDEFKDTLAEWLSDKTVLGKPKHQVCLIVGVLLCRDVVVAQSEAEEQAIRAGGGIPLGTIGQAVAASHGVILPTGGTGDVKGQFDRTGTSQRYFTATGKGVKVFALELKMISSKKGNLQLTDKAPNLPASHHLGADEDEDEVDPESLELKEIDDAVWEEILDKE